MKCRPEVQPNVPTGYGYPVAAVFHSYKYENRFMYLKVNKLKTDIKYINVV